MPATLPPHWLLAPSLLAWAGGGAAQQLSVAGGLNVVGQTTSDSRIRREVVGSADLFLDLRTGPFVWHVYVEASSTPSGRGVSEVLPGANVDAGTALNADRRGRLQISEAKLLLPLGGRVTLTGGLLDATGYLDVSRIANDENLFFLGLPFVNNPTIEFPDYTLGLAVERPASRSGGIEVSGVLTSSHGLADDPDASYAKLFAVREGGKGLFSGVSLRWRTPSGRITLGGWTHTAEQPRFDERGVDKARFGLFGVAGRTWGAHSLSVRLGWADPDARLPAGYVGMTYLWDQSPTAVGLALGHTEGSAAALDRDPSLGHLTHAEAFLRLRLVEDAFVTLSTQYLNNGGFDASGDRYSRRLWVPGVRLAWVH